MAQFKVGDWVCTPHRGVFKVRHEIELASWEITLGGKAKLWQPKVGEWCWFWNMHNGCVVDRSFERFSHRNGILYCCDVGQWSYSYEHIPTCGGWDSVRSDAYINKPMEYRHCEPFIGELPSFLKDNYGSS